MRDEIWEGLLRHVQPLGGFEKAKILIAEPGHAKISILVEENGLNLYGNLHGGYIFTLCDMVSGMCAYAYEVENVTLQSSINFMKAFKTGTLFVEGHSIHKGRSTIVTQVEVTSEEGKCIASAAFTMFLGKPI